jgi:4'-phosphopantetheinyl transferase EntD
MSISERQVAAAIFLSAKESIYKCQYMLTRSWLGFHSLEIDFEPGSDEFRSRLLEDVAGCRRGRYLGGRYASSNDIVTTAVVISTDTAGVEGKLGKAFRRDLR